jgi:hypothetical protein
MNRTMTALLVLSLVAGAATMASGQNVPQRKPQTAPQPTPQTAPQPNVPGAPGQISPRPGGTPQSVVVKLEDLTQAQFKQLADSAVIQVDGQRTTKREFLDRVAREHTAALADVRAKMLESERRFADRREHFLSRRRAMAEDKNAAVRAELARLRAEAGASPAGPAMSLEAIRTEGVELVKRAQTASPAEREKIDQRAQELLDHLHRAR